MASVEALACGAPVVAFERGGARDVVRDGVNGVLYGPEEPGGLAGAVERAARRRFDYTALCESALPFTRERFEREFRAHVENLLRANA